MDREIVIVVPSETAAFECIEGLEAIEAILDPLRARKAEHVVALEAAQTKLRTEMAVYRSVYRNTFGTPAPGVLRISAPASEPFYDWLAH